jgi:hypothetical protein
LRYNPATHAFELRRLAGLRLWKFCRLRANLGFVPGTSGTVVPRATNPPASLLVEVSPSFVIEGCPYSTLDIKHSLVVVAVPVCPASANCTHTT